MIDLSSELNLSVILILTFASTYLLIRHGHSVCKRYWQQQIIKYETVLCKQLLLDIKPQHAMIATSAAITFAFLFGTLTTSSPILGTILAAITFAIPHFLIKHLEAKRRKLLDSQLVDGLTTLASGVRAGLNLIQAIELLVLNHTGPIQQEFNHLLREYRMGLDLNQAMRNTGNRVGSPLYRLTFTAIEMHRKRGGDSGKSLDRIAESIREIHRLEGKLDAITAQGRFQAVMMACMPILFSIQLYIMDPEGFEMLFILPTGRMILLGIIAMLILAFVWIRKILAIDI
ncbi:Bacterial type II secretion system protein F domain protein [Poriferisphaera corsica]|uniref:Bacterial type II secretion system protein F domain protein n=1 Tax=Poriferisphaera corsica TaxID=2528020 RepID=A0A517YUW2_9BACT|nr:type II secretion system F family protein [Poriferisphaera corsica]QDU34038.1 Bacterial type II secretion system protein F domain protein [Poriferisphaera corsica]